MLLDILFFVIVICLTTIGMFIVMYDRQHKTIEMLELPEFVGYFALFAGVSIIFSAFLFAEPVLVLSILFMALVLVGAGFGVYRGMLYLKDYLDNRQTK